MEERLGTLEDPVQGVVTENPSVLNNWEGDEGLPTDNPDDPESFKPLPGKATKRLVPDPPKRVTVGDRLKAAVKTGIKDAGVEQPTPAAVRAAKSKVVEEGLATDDPDDPESFKPLPKKTKPPAEEDENSWLGNITRGIGSRVTGMTGGMLQSTYLKGEAVQDAISKMAQKTGIGELHWDDDGLSWRTSTDEEIDAPSMIGGLLKAGADYLHDTDFGYKQGTTIDDVLNTPLTSVIPFAVEQGLVSLPDMMLIATGYGIPLYIDAHAGEIAVDRAKNDNRPEPTLKDYFAALPGSAISAGLERFGLGKMLHGVGDVAVKTGKDVLKQALKVGGIETLTEGAEELAEYGSESIGTETGFDPVEAGKRTLAGAVAGGPMGVTVRGVTGGLEVRNRGTKLAQIRADRAARTAGQSTPVSPAPVLPATGTVTPPNPQPQSGNGSPPAQPATSNVGNAAQPPNPTGNPNPPAPPGPKAPKEDYGKQPSAGPATTEVILNTTGVSDEHAAALSPDDFEEEMPEPSAAAPAAAPGTPPISREILQHTLNTRASLDPQQRRSLEKKLAELDAEAQAQAITVESPSPQVQPGPAATDVGDVAASAPTPAPQPTPPPVVTQPAVTPEQQAKIDADNAAAKATLDAFPAKMDEYLARREAEQTPVPKVELSPIQRKMAAAAARKAEIQAAAPPLELASAPVAAPKAAKAKAVSKAKAAPVAPAKEVHQERRAEANEQDVADEKQAAAEEAVLSKPGRKRSKGELARVKSRVRSAMTWGSPEGVLPADLNAAIKEETEAVLADPKFIKSQPDSVASEVKKRVKERFAKKPAETPAKTTERPQDAPPASKPTTEAPAEIVRPAPSPEPTAAPKIDLDESERELAGAVAARVREHYENQRDVNYDPGGTGFGPTNVKVALAAVRNNRGKLKDYSRDQLVSALGRIAIDDVKRSIDAQRGKAKELADEQDRKAIVMAQERKEAEAKRKAEIIAKNDPRKKDRRGKTKEDDADTMASRDIKSVERQALKEHKRPESLRDPRMVRIAELVTERRTKGKTNQDEEIKRLHEERVADKRAQEAEAKAKEKAETEKKLANVGKEDVAEETTVDEQLKRKRDRIVSDENQSKIAAQLENKALNEPSLDELNRPGWENKLTGWLRRLIKASPDTGENINPKRSMEEGFLNYAKAFLAGKRPDSSLGEVILVRELLTAAKTDPTAKTEFWNTINNKREAGRVDQDVDTIASEEPELSEEDIEKSMQDLDLAKMADSLSEPTRSTRSIGATAETVSGDTVRVIAKDSARGTLNSFVSKANFKGVRGVLMKMHARAMNKLVGGVTTIMVPPEDMRGAAGRFTYIKDPTYRNGWRPVIMLAEDIATLDPAVQAVLQLHEMTHAATTLAIATNTNGVRDMLKRMVTELKKVPGLNGQYGLTNEFELVSEAYTNDEFRQLLRSTPIDLGMRKDIDALLRAAPIRSWWDLLVRITERAIGKVYPMRSRDNFLGSIMALDPLMSYSESEQQAKFKVQPEHQFDAPKMMDSVKDTLENAKAFAATSPSTKYKQITSALKNLDAVARDSAAYFGGEGNVVETLIDKAKRIAGKVRSKQKVGDRLALKLKGLENKNKTVFDKMYDILDRANTLQLDATGRDNSHVSKKGKRDAHLRHHLPILRAEFDALPKEYRDAYKETVDHYANDLNERLRLIVNNVIRADMEKVGKAFPPGENFETMTQWALSPAIDNAGTNMTARDTAISNALGTTVDRLRATKSFRKVKGNYIPKVRYGKWYFSARHKVDVPHGATMDPNSVDKNQLVFEKESDLRDWQKTTKETYSHPIIRWVDPTNGQTTQQKAMYVDASGNLVIPEARYVVNVQNKTVKMENSRSKLMAEYQRFKADSRFQEVRDVREVDHDTAGLHSEISSAAQALINHIDQSMGPSNVGKQAVINAIRDAEIRHMSSASAMTRQLKRKNVLGYEKDNLPRIVMSTSRSMAGHLVNLEMAGELYKADAAVKKYVNDHANDGKSFEREQLAKQVTNRIKSQATRSSDGYGTQVMDNLLKVVNMVYLASPAYYLLNMTQPFTVTLPALGAKYGYGRFGAQMLKISREMGVGRNLARGLLETGKSTRNFVPGMERYNPGEGNSFGDRAIRRMRRKGVKDVNEIEALWNSLTEIGAGSEGGHEFNSASSLENGVFSEYLDRANDVTRVMSEAIETQNRMTAVVPVYRLERLAGASIEEATRRALNATEMTQGNYSDLNNPSILSHPAGRPFLSFKRYAAMYANLWYGALSRLLTTKGQRWHAAKQLMALGAAGVLFAGTTGLPFMEWGQALVMLANILGASIGADPDDWEDWERWMQDKMSDAVGPTLAEFTSRGYTRALGVDTSNRLGNSSLLFFGEPKEYDGDSIVQYMFDSFGGAGPNMLLDAYSTLVSGDPKLEKLPVPKIIRDVSKASDRMKEGTVNSAGRQVGKEWSVGEAISQGIGFSPASNARTWEGGSGTQNKLDKKTHHARMKLLNDLNNAADDPDERAAVKDEIREWNRNHKGRDKITQDTILKSKNKRKQDDKAMRKANP